MPNTHHCLFCHEPLQHVFADLGTCPPSNAFLSAEQLTLPEVYHPLQAYVCEKCLLVQGPHFKRPQDIFNHDYVYHSSWSRSWVEHAKTYVHDVVQRFDLGPQSLMMEVGSNDGYLLQHAVALHIPCLGIDPSSGAASIAQTKGIPTVTDFFGTKLARTLADNGKQADLLCGINVFAHVPDINDFVAGMALVLKPQGVMSMEFPHLLRLVEDVQFDTIYHEHYFYYTLACVQNIVQAHGLRVFDVQCLPTHGGSLRIFACHASASHAQTPNVDAVLQQEATHGMHNLAFYTGFQDKIEALRYELLQFLMQVKQRGQRIVGFGAAAKGNTMINYFGIRKDLLPFVADTSPIKQGKFLPGSRIPVLSEEAIRETRPDYILILPWNLQEEISQQLSYVRDWGCQFVTAIPRLSLR